MSHAFSDIAFTPSVLRAQQHNGSRLQGPRNAGDDPANLRLGPDEATFISAQRSFYLSTVSGTGWPYVQHRGGPPGFLKVIDEQTLSFADFAGNRQMISVGNLTDNDRAAVIMVDYANQRRLKILGHLTVHDLVPGSDEGQRVVTPGYRSRPERVMILTVAGFDWNCPQHIPVRYEAEDVRQAIAARDARIADLERLLSASDVGPA